MSQALARTFDRCDGVDISETMVELARKYNRHGEACQYHVNLESNLALFESNTFDFIFSTIVLQHNPPDTAEHYISEFCRVLSPGGVAVFDMTASLNVRHLPEQSHRAEISIDSALPELRAGEQATIRASVTNVGGLDWPAGCWLAAGNHWRAPDSAVMVVRDDARTVMHEGLAAGQTVSVDLTVTAPPAAGTYLLDIDLVEEQVAWFADCGSSPVSVNVVVRRPRGRLQQRIRSMLNTAPAAAEEPAPFSMNGLTRDRVEAAVVRSGGQIADVLPSLSGGHHWDGYRYFVSKPPG